MTIHTVDALIAISNLSSSLHQVKSHGYAGYASNNKLDQR